jgi:hypothetical protein
MPATTYRIAVSFDAIRPDFGDIVPGTIKIYEVEASDTLDAANKVQGIIVDSLKLSLEGKIIRPGVIL